MTTLTRAAILARGLGTRMRKAAAATLDAEQAKAADAGMKAMIPIGRPFLDYVISALADAGITDVCLVIGPEHDRIREHYTREVDPQRVRIHFAIQPEARGTADAVLAAESFAGGETMLVLNSDNYYPVSAYRALVDGGVAALPGFERRALIAHSNVDADRIRSYALLRVAPDGTLEDIVEKPDVATFAAMGDEALVSMNLWAFPPQIFDACRRIEPSARGELELPDAVRLAIRELGVRFQVIRCADGVLDLSSRTDIAAVARALAGVAVRL